MCIRDSSKEIAFSPAVELSYLTRDEQKQFLGAMDYSQNTHPYMDAQEVMHMTCLLYTSRCV